MATFNIGSQNAACIQNIGGDAVIHGGIQASATQVLDLRSALARVQEESAAVPLPLPVRASVDAALSAASAEAASAAPDRARVAEQLGVATRAMHTAGAIRAGMTIVEAVRMAAVLLGPLGHAAIACL